MTVWKERERYEGEKKKTENKEKTSSVRETLTYDYARYTNTYSTISLVTATKSHRRRIVPGET